MAGSQAQASLISSLQLSAHKRAADEYASADRHSRRVRLAKFVIPLVALLAGVFFAAKIFFRNELPVDVSTAGVSLSDGRVVMANPKLDGMTGDKRPYKMQAERAFQELKKEGLVELEKITATLPFGKETTADLTAGAGVFDHGKNLLNLTHSVLLKTNDGMVANLTSAAIDIGQNTLVSNEPVDITAKGSHITADSMHVSDGGKHLIFDKKVRLNIDPKQFNKSAGDDATQTPN